MQVECFSCKIAPDFRTKSCRITNQSQPEKFKDHNIVANTSDNTVESVYTEKNAEERSKVN